MLTGKQKRYLRSLGMTQDPIFQVGKAGIGVNMLATLADALEAKELIKVRVLTNCPQEPKAAAQELAQSLSAELVQVIGRNLLLFRPSQEKPQIELPR